MRIALAGDEVGRGAYRGRVKLGMAGQAEIVTARESLLSILVRRIRQSTGCGGRSWVLSACDVPAYSAGLTLTERVARRR